MFHERRVHLPLSQSNLFTHGQNTILPTALINVHHAAVLFTVRALFDAGSEKSFVSSGVQQHLAIQHLAGPIDITIGRDYLPLLILVG